MQPTIYLLSSVFVGSSVVWWHGLGRLLQNRPLLDKVEEPQPGWRTIPELMVAFVALFCVCMAISVSVRRLEDREPLTLAVLALQALVPIGLAIVLILALTIGGHPLAAYGIKFSKIGQQMKTGVVGYLAAVLPMAISMVATFQFRSRETEHSLLKSLDGSPGQLTIVLVLTAAILSAPLWEELQFRVILQGWLTTIFPAPAAVGIVACTFALVHGWRDGLALLPLAVILGYVFDRQRSYLSVVVIHALFNATMVVLHLLNVQEAS